MAAPPGPDEPKRKVVGFENKLAFDTYSSIFDGIKRLMHLNGGNIASANPPEMRRGMIEPGNIDLFNRPVVKNRDGSISTVLSQSRDFGDGQEVLYPGVSEDGRTLTPDQATEQYLLSGKHLGIFRNPIDSDAYAETLHQEQANRYAPKARRRK